MSSNPVSSNPAPPDERGGFIGRSTDSVNRWISNFVVHHTTTEWLVGLAIILIWAVIAFASIGPAAALAAVTFAIVLHYVAMETGSHVWLWMATTVMLLFVLVAYASVLNNIGPMALAIGGAMVLIYNESIRLNYNRRRDAVVDSGVFAGSAIATVIATVIGIVGIGASVLLGGQSERNWLWMPAAVITLMIVAYAVTLIPVRQAPPTSRQRWEPGTRIPPRPVSSGPHSLTPPPPPPPGSPPPPSTL